MTKTLVVLTADHGEYVPIVEYNNKIINLEASDNEAKLWKIGNRIPNISTGTCFYTYETCARALCI